MVLILRLNLAVLHRHLATPALIHVLIQALTYLNSWEGGWGGLDNAFLFNSQLLEVSLGVSWIVNVLSSSVLVRGLTNGL